MKVRNENVIIVSRKPYPRPQRLDAANDAAAPFNGVYMRPNLGNTGTVPAVGTLSSCPDIWIANQTPVQDPQTTLASDASYATSSNNNIMGGMANYIYVRAKNGTATAQTKNVTLYYAPSGIIQWPGQWKGNVIPTDNKALMANITNLASGAIGVADGTFEWDNPPPPPSGSDHYCLISQINDAQNSNPFPSIYTVLDIAQMVSNNLGWGWKNISYIPAPSGAFFVGTSPLCIDPTTIAPGDTYMIWTTPVNFVGWSVQITCSQRDSNGKEITFGPNPVNVTQEGQVIGVLVTLKPGFSSSLSLTMYSNGHSAQPGATAQIICSYQTSATNSDEALARGLVDRELEEVVKDALAAANASDDIPITKFVGIGAYSWVVK